MTLKAKRVLSKKTFFLNLEFYQFLYYLVQVDTRLPDYIVFQNGVRVENLVSENYHKGSKFN
jgi:hypothetical protein